METTANIHDKARLEGVSAHLVLKETLHGIVLDYLFQKGIFTQLVFQGGTAIRMCYQGIRYSEDLDFVLNKGVNVKAVFKNLSKIMEELPGHMERSAVFIESASLKSQRDTGTFKRYTLAIKAEGFQAIDKTNLEVAAVPSYENQPLLIRSESLGLNPAVTVETPREILSDKICAFGLREYIKGRDLWDLHYLVYDLGIAVEDHVRKMSLKKVEDYGAKKLGFLKAFQSRLSRLSKEGPQILKLEMDRFLPLSYRRMFQPRYEQMNGEIAKFLGDFYEAVR
jgi:predicted nucleotidyltransferase component of viral defense system